MNQNACFAQSRPAGLLIGSKMGRVVCLAVFVLFGSVTQNLLGQNQNSIVNSKHNLSFSGPGDIRSATEGEICVFCHAPHSRTGQSPL